MQSTYGGYGRINQTLAGGLTRRATPSAVPGSIMTARFNSTSSTASVASGTTASEGAADQAAQTEAGDISGLSLSDIDAIPEHTGYLKQLGLDYGWGPSSMIEWVIEHIHIWSGLPWWASIVGTGLLVRLALLYPMLGASDTAARMQNIKHIINPLRTKMLQTNTAGNMVEATRIRAEMSKLQSDHGIKPIKSFIPFLQVPLGFGCYRVVNGMTSLPVPGLAVEAAGWLKDLTVADPVFILPALSATFMHLTLRKGGEAGMNDMLNSSFGKAFLYGLPAISFAFMAFFPSALQLYFVSTGLFALGQSYLVQNESFRKFAGMAIPKKMVDPAAAEAGNNDLRMLQDLMKAQQAKLVEAQKESAASQEANISFIDRMVNSFKENKNNIQREATEKINEFRGSGPTKNADGSVAEPPRLSEKDQKLAADYERRRREEEEWKREERNHAKRAEYMKALERQREKARASFSQNQR